jgi:hypothetical protein
MKRAYVVTTMVAALSALTVSGFAAPSKQAAADVAPTVPSLATMLDGIHWGMNHTQVTQLYNQVGGLFDQEYNPQLVKLQPGVRMQALEAERENRKQAFATSFVEFKDTPTGYDATGIKGEYTYRNHESLQVVERPGRRRYFFYIGQPPGERLWKVYDEVTLGEAAPYGKTFQEAVNKITATVSVPGRVKGPEGPRPTTVDWQDASTHLRAVDRTNTHVVAVVLEDKGTLTSIDQLRAHKAEDPTAIDPSIQAVTRGGITDPNAAITLPDGGVKAKPKK